MSNMRVSRRLHNFYDELTSVDAILRALARDQPEEGMVTAADLYTRSLDCQNQGGTPSVIARKFTVSLGGCPRINVNSLLIAT